MAYLRHGLIQAVTARTFTSGSSRRAAPLGLAFAMVALAVSGCNPSGLSPTPAATTSAASPSPADASASPSSSLSYSVPPEAREQTDAGAIAFVRFYVSQANLAWTTPDSTLMPPLSGPGCKSCDSIHQGAVALVKNGQRYAREPVTIGQVSVDTPSVGGQPVIKVDVHQEAVDIIDSAGATVQKSVADDGHWLIALTWVDGRWLVDGMA